MKKLLLHCCCAPCAAPALELLVNNYDITLYFFNPNIYPQEEYHKRLEQLKKLKDIKYTDFKLIERRYDYNDFLNVSKGMENQKEGGERCFKCFKLRLFSSAETAKNNGFDLFATTLTVSPYKNSAVIFDIAKQAGDKYKIDFLYKDFKSHSAADAAPLGREINCNRRGIEICREAGIYRQKYCGCEYSVR